MKSRSRWRSFGGRCGLLAAVAIFNLSISNLPAAQVYWQNFDSGTGTPSTTPGGGVLALSSPAVFSTTGGIFGGSMDASANPNNSTGGTGGASTVFAGGSGISGLPNQTGNGVGSMNQFTISFWFNPTTIRTSGTASSVHHRLVFLGDSATTDFTGANAFSILQRNNTGAAPINPSAIDIWAKGISATGATGTAPTTGGFAGTASAVGTWWFVAVTYDGTSSLGNNSTVQQTATGGVSTVNGQLYWGNNTTSVTRFDAPITAIGGDPTAASAGAFEFSNSANVFMANNANPNRSWDGFMDDVRIYSSVLTPAEVEQVRIAGLSAPAIPGDFDNDQDVDGADFVAWQTNFPTQTGATRAQGDADGDGDVDGADFVVWQTNFPFPPSPGAAPVPEPAGFVLLVAASLMGCAWLRTREKANRLPT